MWKFYPTVWQDQEFHKSASSFMKRNFWTWLWLVLFLSSVVSALLSYLIYWQSSGPQGLAVYVKHTCRLFHLVTFSISLAETENKVYDVLEPKLPTIFFASFFTSLPSFIVSSCWSVSLDNIMKQHVEKSTKHWFSIYQMIEKYVQEQTEANTEGKCWFYMNVWCSSSNYEGCIIKVLNARVWQCAFRYSFCPMLWFKPVGK